MGRVSINGLTPNYHWGGHHWGGLSCVEVCICRHHHRILADGASFACLVVREGGEIFFYLACTTAFFLSSMYDCFFLSSMYDCFFFIKHVRLLFFIKSPRHKRPWAKKRLYEICYIPREGNGVFYLACTTAFLRNAGHPKGTSRN